MNSTEVEAPKTAESELISMGYDKINTMSQSHEGCSLEISFHKRGYDKCLLLKFHGIGAKGILDLESSPKKWDGLLNKPPKKTIHSIVLPLYDPHNIMQCLSLGKVQCITIKQYGSEGQLLSRS